jgi:hypothetical protein
MTMLASVTLLAASKNLRRDRDMGLRKLVLMIDIFSRGFKAFWLRYRSLQVAKFLACHQWSKLKLY